MLNSKILLNSFQFVNKELSYSMSPLNKLIRYKIISINEIIYGILLFEKYCYFSKNLQEIQKNISYFVYIAIYIAHKVLNDNYFSIKYFINILYIDKFFFKKLEMHFLKKISYETNINLQELLFGYNILSSFYKESSKITTH